MEQFMLCLYEDPSGWATLSPEDMQKAVEKYIAWGKNAFVKGGHRLDADLGKVMRMQGSKPVATDGPYSETKEVLGGIYLIEAKNYDEAVKFTLDHPHLAYGGTIEVRRLFPEM